ncbi:hypothetical protein AB1A91_22725, partial [Stenotrophomonas maltophilia]|uniref:hypothetical protein n=1 Tax=Stenotrophomonas maltophilia TaxID=40324 RepID=UPI003455C4E1
GGGRPRPKKRVIFDWREPKKYNPHQKVFLYQKKHPPPKTPPQKKQKKTTITPQTVLKKPPQPRAKILKKITKWKTHPKNNFKLK